MRISDWSSDVCSSDLPTVAVTDEKAEARSEAEMLEQRLITAINKGGLPPSDGSRTLVGQDRQSVVSGKSVSVRVDLGGRRIIITNHQVYHKVYMIELYNGHICTAHPA